MNIIILSDFSNVNISKDFSLANALRNEHTILLVTNEKQLNDAINAYDIIIEGFSSSLKVDIQDKPLIKIEDSYNLDYIIDVIKKKTT